jgi:hypothetical protein
MLDQGKCTCSHGCCMYLSYAGQNGMTSIAKLSNGINCFEYQSQSDEEQ